MNTKSDACEAQALARFAFDIQNRNPGMTREQALSEALLWFRGAQKIIRRHKSCQTLFTLEQSARLLGWNRYRSDKWRILLRYWRQDNGQEPCEEMVDRLMDRHLRRGVTGDEVIYFRMLLAQRGGVV